MSDNGCRACVLYKLCQTVENNRRVLHQIDTRLHCFDPPRRFAKMQLKDAWVRALCRRNPPPFVGGKRKCWSTSAVINCSARPVQGRGVYVDAAPPLEVGLDEVEQEGSRYLRSFVASA